MAGMLEFLMSWKILVKTDWKQTISISIRSTSKENCEREIRTRKRTKFYWSTEFGSPAVEGRPIIEEKRSAQVVVEGMEDMR